MEKTILEFWKNIGEQNTKALEAFFWPDAKICWHNTDEQFTVAEFIRATCEYPGRWKCDVEYYLEIEKRVITVTKVYNLTEKTSLYATSFFLINDGKIQRLDEYWGDNGVAPQWRRDLHIGTKIEESTLF